MLFLSRSRDETAMRFQAAYPSDRLLPLLLQTSLASSPACPRRTEPLRQLWLPCSNGEHQPCGGGQGLWACGGIGHLGETRDGQRPEGGTGLLHGEEGGAPQDVRGQVRPDQGSRPARRVRFPLG